MPYKRRITKERDGQITSEAVEIYRRGLKAMRRGDDDVLRDFSYRLAGELGLKPWMTCPLDTIGHTAPAGWEDTDREREDWHRSKALANRLEKALRARRRATREARKAAAAVPDQPPPG
jgi:hypothetical protein